MVNKNNITLYIGIFILISSFFPFSPSGLILLNFFIGFIGILVSLLNKKTSSYIKIKLIFLNFLIFISFFIAMFLAYFFNNIFK